jgi:hypothetical protein
VSDLSAQLRMLRQAACHPQLGSRGIASSSISASHRRKLGSRVVSGLDYQVTDRGMQVPIKQQFSPNMLLMFVGIDASSR